MDPFVFIHMKVAEAKQEIEMKKRQNSDKRLELTRQRLKNQLGWAYLNNLFVISIDLSSYNYSILISFYQTHSSSPESVWNDSDGYTTPCGKLGSGRFGTFP